MAAAKDIDTVIAEDPAVREAEARVQRLREELAAAQNERKRARDRAYARARRERKRLLLEAGTLLDELGLSPDALRAVAEALAPVAGHPDLGGELRLAAESIADRLAGGGGPDSAGTEG